MENLLNRRMFTAPIRAAEGTYVPTIEQILNFYGGGFDDTGQPLDIEAFQLAIANANAANEAGLFPGKGKPVDNWLYAGKDQKQFMKDQNIDTMYEPTLGYFANNFKPSDKERDFLSTYLATDEVPPDERLLANNIPQEGIKIDDDLTVFNADNLPADLKAEVDAKDKAEDDYAQRQLDIANQKELFEGLKNTGIKNLAGDTTQPITGDENIEIIKRNILQGTNVLTEDDFKNLPAVDRMKIKDALSQKRREEVDLTDVSESGLQNIIDAAGSSAEVAIEIYNDMRNAGGEVAEAAGEMLEGWKKAISSGFNEEQKKSLNDQIEYLKSKKDPDEQTWGEWYNDTIIKEGIDKLGEGIRGVWGSTELGDGTLSPDLQAEMNEQVLRNELKQDLPSYAEEFSFKSKVDETKNKVVNKIDEVKNAFVEEYPELSKKIETQLDDLKDKLENNLISKEDFISQVEKIKTDTLEIAKDKTTEVKDKISEVIDGIKEDGLKLTLKETTEKIIEKGGEVIDSTKDKISEVVTGMSAEERKLRDDLAKDIPSYAVDSPVETQEEVEKINETIESGDENLDSDKSGLDIANESTTSGGTTSGGTLSGGKSVEQLIAETAKETGYDFKGLEGTKDDMALKTMMYGLKLFLTPGKFKDAAAETGMLALKNEINERYKTKAAQAKFKGELFKTLLAGKLDIEKELVKLKNTKPTKLGEYNIDKGTLQNSTAAWVKNNMGLNIDMESLNEGVTDDNKVEFMFMQNLNNEVQKILNNKYNAGEDPSLTNEIISEAYANLGENFKVTPRDRSIVNKVTDFIFMKSDEDIRKENIEKGDLTYVPSNKRVVTEEMIDTVIQTNPNLNLTRDQVIKALQGNEQFKGWDFSEVV